MNDYIMIFRKKFSTTKLSYYRVQVLVAIMTSITRLLLSKNQENMDMIYERLGAS